MMFMYLIETQEFTIVTLLQKIVAILLCGLRINVKPPNVVGIVQVRNKK